MASHFLAARLGLSCDDDRAYPTVERKASKAPSHSVYKLHPHSRCCPNPLLNLLHTMTTSDIRNTHTGITPTREEVCFLPQLVQLDFWLDSLHVVLPAASKIPNYQGAFYLDPAGRADLLERVVAHIRRITRAYNRANGHRDAPILTDAESVFVKFSQPSAQFGHIFAELGQLIGVAPRNSVQDIYAAAHRYIVCGMRALEWPLPAALYPAPSHNHAEYAARAAAVPAVCTSAVCHIHAHPARAAGPQPPRRPAPPPTGYSLRYRGEEVRLPFPNAPPPPPAQDRLPGIQHMDYFSEMGRFDRRMNASRQGEGQGQGSGCARQ
ncbi:hypothetical protein MIND_00301400 [Mycena indigotica]|uniref:Uncharacterized protein n=1 Tax=Mycena indigotica TaxID=2126181 RepID=A0A8H6T302_9AGAR|nr:uncharacterized protein MIND_00301400 [Mycena indigotica]KAF7309311.1 hypothetical protein MIND_00301400 [Mycena indigotica]